MIMSIRDNIARLRENIARVALSCGRSPDGITLVAASKYTDADGIREAYEAGIETFGENRVQDALAKIETLPKDIHWHMIGHLQRNKAKFAVGAFELIHSVDSVELAEQIQKVAIQKEIIQDILIEVNVTGEFTKFGVAPERVPELVGGIRRFDSVSLVGLMTMAPFVADAGAIAACFAGLRDLRDRLETEFGASLPQLSMGMTNDYEIAIREGATLLRIGSAIFR